MIAKLKNILRCYAIGMGINETANTFHISRNTVRKYVRVFLSSGKTTELLHINHTGIIAAIGGASLGLGFALRDTIENFFYGLTMMTGRARPGDIVSATIFAE